MLCKQKHSTPNVHGVKCKTPRFHPNCADQSTPLVDALITGCGPAADFAAGSEGGSIHHMPGPRFQPVARALFAWLGIGQTPFPMQSMRSSSWLCIHLITSPDGCQASFPCGLLSHIVYMSTIYTICIGLFLFQIPALLVIAERAVELDSRDRQPDQRSRLGIECQLKRAQIIFSRYYDTF